MALRSDFDHRLLRTVSGAFWTRLAEQGEMVVASDGSPVAVLVAVNEETLEETLDAIRRVRAMAALETLQQDSIAAGTDRMNREEIEREIETARRSRRGTEGSG